MKGRRSALLFELGSFTPMPKDEMNQLSRGLADKHKLALDRYFHDHIDC